jgi:aminoglycoside phosphotransferase (APT) family kinase protein
MRPRETIASNISGLLAGREGYVVTGLTGGFWNEVYRVRGHGRDWVVKVFRGVGGEGLYPVFPEAEALALETLAGLGIAPEPVAFLAAGPVLVYEFFAGEVGVEDGAAIGRLLRRLHGVDVPPESGFRLLPVTPEAILGQGDGILGLADRDDLTEQLRGLRPGPVSLPPLERLSLVHTDTWAGNFVQNGRELRLIDWQCPGLGDPAEDVWTFLYAGYEMLLGWPRFGEGVIAEFWLGYGVDTAVSHHLQILAPTYTYRLAAHCCLRQKQLAATNPTASANYQKIYTYLIANLAG